MQFEMTAQEEALFKTIAQAAQKLGFPTYVIGGYVRDRLLGRSSKGKDLDLVCVGSGIKLAKAIAKSLKPQPKVVTYARFGTAALHHKDWEIELVGARKESYRPESRKPIVEDGTLEDDQNRRDFTINALAISLNEADFGQLLDPFGGLADLEAKCIRTPLAPETTFSDDPLRMMRAIRFASQLGFEIEEKTFAAIQSERERIHIISQERISSELNKIMLSTKPSLGLSLLFKSGLLELIFPELYAMHGVEEKEGVRHKDNFWHTLKVVDNMAEKSDDLWMRWSALLHDIAKPLTKRYFKGQGWSFHGHEAVGGKLVPKIFKRFKLPLDQKMKKVQKIVSMHQRPILLTQDRENITDSAIRRLLFEAGDDLEDLLLMCEADSTTANPKKLARYADNLIFLRQRLQEVEEKDHLRQWQPPISGAEIMETFQIKPSRTVGQLKNAIREAILDGLIANEYEAARNFMLEQAAAMDLFPKK